MIGNNGEWIYTNSEIAFELGVSPATVNAVGKRIFGDDKAPRWSIQEVKLIAEYIKPTPVDVDSKRLTLLHTTILCAGFGKLDDNE